MVWRVCIPLSSPKPRSFSNMSRVWVLSLLLATLLLFLLLSNTWSISLSTCVSYRMPEFSKEISFSFRLSKGAEILGAFLKKGWPSSY